MSSPASSASSEASAAASPSVPSAPSASDSPASASPARVLLRNALRFAALLLAVSFVVFFLVSASPIDPVQSNVGQAAYVSMSEEKRAQLAEYWGAGTPFLERYLDWLVAFLHGDMGVSLRFNAPVSEVIAVRAVNSLALMASAWLISGVLGFAMGVVAGVFRGRLVDKIIKGYCFVLASTPTFWLGLLFLMIFAVGLGWFPVGFSVPLGKSAADVTLFDAAHHLVLPALTLSVLGVANIALHTREKTIDVLESDYVRFARARGLSTPAVVARHGLRNLALPALTLQFASISEIFGGSVLVEQVFSYPGLGQAAVTAGLGGDAALLAGIAVFSAALVFAGNFVANALYAVVDPRIRDARRAGGACGIWMDKSRLENNVRNFETAEIAEFAETPQSAQSVQTAIAAEVAGATRAVKAAEVTSEGGASDE